MNNNQFDKIVENIQDSMYCHVCGESYEGDDIKYLGQLDVMVFLQLECHNCHSQVLATIATDPDQVVFDTDMGLANEKSNPESRSKAKKSNQSLISFDDVIAVHEDLEEYSGDPQEWVEKITAEDSAEE